MCALWLKQRGRLAAWVTEPSRPAAAAGGWSGCGGWAGGEIAKANSLRRSAGGSGAGAAEGGRGASRPPEKMVAGACNFDMYDLGTFAISLRVR